MPPCAPSPIRSARIDAYPEGRPYYDTGCHVAPSCLSCPLAECVFDHEGLPGHLIISGRSLAEGERNRALCTQLFAEGLSIAEIVEATGLSRRRVEIHTELLRRGEPVHAETRQYVARATARGEQTWLLAIGSRP